MGQGQSAGIVQPVPHHQDAAAIGAETLQTGDLFLRCGFSGPVADPEGPSQRGNGAILVSRHYLQLDALVSKRLKRLSSTRLYIINEAKLDRWSVALV